MDTSTYQTSNINVTYQYINTSTHQHIDTSTHQHINTSTHQHINTSTHQHINTSTHQHINTSTHQLTNTCGAEKKMPISKKVSTEEKKCLFQEISSPWYGMPRDSEFQVQKKQKI